MGRAGGGIFRERSSRQADGWKKGEKGKWAVGWAPCREINSNRIRIYHSWCTRVAYGNTAANRDIPLWARGRDPRLGNRGSGAQQRGARIDGGGHREEDAKTSQQAKKG